MVDHFENWNRFQKVVSISTAYFKMCNIVIKSNSAATWSDFRNLYSMDVPSPEL